MGSNSSRKFAALQVLLRAFGVRANSARTVGGRRPSRAAVEVVSDFGVGPTFPGMR